jgi:menaquinone-specific isochorismate synthase
MASLIPVTTNRLGAHLPLLELLPDDQQFAWVRGSEGLIGWGEYASIRVSGRDRFEQVRTWWHQQLETFSIADSVHSSGTGPVLFTSLSFDRNEESFAFIPKVIVGKRGDKSWITWVGESPQPSLTDKSPVFSSQEFSWSAGTLTEEQWKKRVVQAIEKIESGSVEKVVLARDLIASSHAAIDARPILRTLAENYPSTWVFSVAGLIGATPELLLRLSRGMVTSRVLAGTIPKTGDDSKDLALAGSLARSSKDL